MNTNKVLDLIQVLEQKNDIKLNKALLELKTVLAFKESIDSIDCLEQLAIESNNKKTELKTVKNKKLKTY
ncbi:MAG: hypothetical protein ACRCXZ_03310 [Patescibacteria group bacterium]